MNSYQKLQRKVEIYEAYLDNIKSLMKDLQDPKDANEWLPEDAALTPNETAVLKQIGYWMEKDYYKTKEAIWKL